MDLVDRLTVWRCRGLSVDEDTSCYKEKVNENPNTGKSLLQTKTELINLPGQKVKFHLYREFNGAAKQDQVQERRTYSRVILNN